jgi:hypothetical protein
VGTEGGGVGRGRYTFRKGIYIKERLALDLFLLGFQMQIVVR